MSGLILAVAGPVIVAAGALQVSRRAAGAGPDMDRTAMQQELAGTSWRLVAIQSMDDRTYSPEDRSKYTVAFGADHSLTVRADCNRGRGTWQSAGPGQLGLGSLALTRAHCGEAWLHDRYVADLGHVRSYVLRDGHLFLSTMADGSILEFEPN
jgi:para-nitrobenzyl esterase